ncbi:hypothetical protein UCD39_22415 [Nitrospirillum sp. BR 11752]|uniref:hypothetical protein n=1 Tax=Nitrospirillum sp. BR 11752 TaxID=3104293 RepID=UPI002EA1FF6B|nr:hypothetical protein [Nitrospirillum sp. BR 11752]
MTHKTRIALAAGLLILTGCGATIPPDASFNTPRPPMITHSLAANTQTTRNKGAVLYSDVSSRLVPGVILDGEIDFNRLFGDIKFHPGDTLITYPYNNTNYYCPQSEPPTSSGLDANSFCFVDENKDGHLTKIQMFEFTNTHGGHSSATAYRFLMTFTVAPAPYHAGMVPFGPMSVQSDLVFDGVQDGYAVIEHRLHEEGRDDAIVYRRKFFAPVPQQQPVTLTIPLLPFDGMSIPEAFSAPALAPLMLTLIVNQANDHGIQYSIQKPWAPWRMPQGIQQKGDFTTIPTTP